MGVADLRPVPDSATEPTNEEPTTPAPSIRRRVSPIPVLGDAAHNRNRNRRDLLVGGARR
jgi:hypothetical protein